MARNAVGVQCEADITLREAADAMIRDPARQERKRGTRPIMLFAHLVALCSTDPVLPLSRGRGGWG
jgi:hypothetical protein